MKAEDMEGVEMELNITVDLCIMASQSASAGILYSL